MAEKRSENWAGNKFTPAEIRFLMDCQHILGDMEAADVVRKCLAIALPLLVHNSYLRRVELEDIMESLKKSVISA